MSKPLRIALVAEGPTDGVVLQAAIAAVVGNRPFQFTLLQPDFSVAFGGTGTGWGGVYRWCEQACSEGDGHVSDSVLFDFHDLLVVHLDADVAGKNYRDHSIDDDVNDLPCEQPCPPCIDTTNALRTVLLRWMGEPSTPSRCVLCTPSKNTETWVMAAFFPSDPVMKKKGWECYETPAARLASQPLKQRFKKSVSDYRQRSNDLKQAWPQVRKLNTEAMRFEEEILLELLSVEPR